ncbi:M14 family metallopeptidase [Bizionia paragorgiae]|uniref:M14 family metallopeptidase n=1 Tax=Bizionia paragorgiae TaxID=283786 RepID=UPI00299DB293|nr:M14 family metallopeptidase [Bizionia paragorgiae]MDX1270911.1 M14 family metallopeptidase [Bizionia paragorgiae]
MEIDCIKSLFFKYKEKVLFGRYINNKHIEPLLKRLSEKFKVSVIGRSVNTQNIYSITVGQGPVKILMWSQMHGNESTTTKALFDLINLLESDSEESRRLLSHFTLVIIPILNPDGAEVYTRLNANLVDLNRDAQQQSQPESRALRLCFNEFKPDFCFNLHGQRTIFSAGPYSKVATLSFLSPAQDEERSITATRAKAMAVIGKMAESLQSELDGQIGVYDDSFNINCVGDTFQSLNVPTILFEAGHYHNDYEREEVRRFVFQSYLLALNAIITPEDTNKAVESYLKIPQNEKRFFDVLIKNVLIEDDIKDIAIQFEEQLVDGAVTFVPKIVKIEKTITEYGHRTIMGDNKSVVSTNYSSLQVGDIVNSLIINNELLALKLGNN